jgi:hypothetical protein
LPKDAFGLVTGEVLQNARAQFPERQFLVDENVQAVADRINGESLTSNQKIALVAQYAGHWIIVGFSLGDHTSRFGMEIVRAQTPAEVEPEGLHTPLRYVLTCIFDSQKWNEELREVAIGTRLTVMGQIEQLSAHEIRLRHCDLV